MRVEGKVRVPGDKSISHRSLMLAALAEGGSTIRGILDSADVQSTAAVLRALGVRIPPLSAEFSVLGKGARSFSEPTADLDCGNSGTTTRLMSGIASACPFTSRFTGDASLSRRPMLRVARPLGAMGARFEFEGGDGLPMRITGGPLVPITWTTEAASAQIKSAILLAGIAANVEVEVREPSRSRDHTERMLAAQGAKVVVNGSAVQLAPPASGRLGPLCIAVPSDPSSAAFLAALAALADEGAMELPDVCLNPTRTGFFRALQLMGARVETGGARLEGGEDVGTVTVHPSRLRGIDLPVEDVPSMIDELPLLACVAARAEGSTRVRGAAELRVKESDRIATVVSNLRAIGVAAEEAPDGFTVTGSDRPLAGRVRTLGDHRIAMAFGVLGAIPGNDIEIDDPSCVSVSYPAFWDDLRRVVVA
ncbi:MAG TPA: 3-phosphoshikimate 1-carboxyvinyltransferase [Gemmatimonadaceae bacterium]|nr:3-phosphoshikimate 1-carboxyvinyltransferase [Gemmatimonadaceae bacterium]